MDLAERQMTRDLEQLKAAKDRGMPITQEKKQALLDGVKQYEWDQQRRQQELNELIQQYQALQRHSH